MLAQANVSTFYVEPPKLTAKSCIPRKTFPPRPLDWSASLDGLLPEDVSGEEILFVVDQFATGVGPLRRTSSGRRGSFDTSSTMIFLMRLAKRASGWRNS